MSRGLLLDSHVLIWLDSDSLVNADALFAIGEARAVGRLFISDLSVWELGVAQHKKNLERRPNLRGLSIEAWFDETTKEVGARRVTVSKAIAIEAANVPGIYGSGDPGDCFLIATARVRKLALVTRDSNIVKLAKQVPGYLDVIVC